MFVLKKTMVLAGLGLSLLANSGCQTWIPEAGVTMPTGEWLLHPPQFFPPTPAFPLNNEMRSMQNAYRNLPPDGQ